jgi:hypothetical protein
MLMITMITDVGMISPKTANSPKRNDISHSQLNPYKKPSGYQKKNPVVEVKV